MSRHLIFNVLHQAREAIHDAVRERGEVVIIAGSLNIGFMEQVFGISGIRYYASDVATNLFKISFSRAVRGDLNVVLSPVWIQGRKFINISYYEYEHDDPTARLNKLGFITNVSTNQKYPEMLGGDTCIICHSEPAIPLINDCCGGHLVCATCALIYRKCVICRNTEIKYYYGGKIATDHAIEHIADRFNKYLRNDNSGGFKKIASVGSDCMPEPEQYRVVLTDAHPRDMNHYDYDIIITKNPTINIHNLDYQFMASDMRATNLHIIIV